jgi:hypothetical protein
MTSRIDRLDQVQSLLAKVTAKGGGPRTKEGKAISSQNAITHGLTAQSPLLPSENPAGYEAFLASARTRLSPDNPEFDALVVEYADITWRLRRAAAHEAKLIHLECTRMQIERQDDDDLDDLLNAIEEAGNDAETLEALAVDRLFQSKTLVNLHRQEDRLNRRLVRVKAEIEQEKKRVAEDRERKAKAEKAAMVAAQNELVGKKADPETTQTKPVVTPESPRRT